MPVARNVNALAVGVKAGEHPANDEEPADDDEPADEILELELEDELLALVDTTLELLLELKLELKLDTELGIPLDEVIALDELLEEPSDITLEELLDVELLDVDTLVIDLLVIDVLVVTNELAVELVVLVADELRIDDALVCTLAVDWLDSEGCFSSPPPAPHALRITLRKNTKPVAYCFDKKDCMVCRPQKKFNSISLG